MKTLTSAPKLLTLLMLMMVNFSAYGFGSIFYSFKDRGVRFLILSNTDRTVSVVGGDEEDLSKDIEISPKVIYNSKTYDVIEIGDKAFGDCKFLTSVTIPNSVTTIGAYAFAGTSLTSVTIPNAVTKIGNCAFWQCRSLTSVTIPNSVMTIGGSVFSDCNSLESINVDPENSCYSSIEGVLYNKDASTILKYPQGNKASSFSIPNSVITIDGGAFCECSSLTSVTIPNSVTTIDGGAFYECSSLTSVTIPNSVTAIGASTFSGCSSLTSVTIPNSVKTIGASTFSGCSSLTSVTIPNSVTTIGASTFLGCSSLTSVTIPNSVKTIGAYAFCECSSLTSVTIPNSVTTIDKRAFSKCSSLTSVTIPNSVTAIESEAFYYCRFLTSVTIPNSVIYLGTNAFYDCGLKCIYMQIKEPLGCPQVVSDWSLKSCILYVPTGTLEAYKKVDPWRNFWNIEEMEYSGINDVGTDNEETLQFSVNDGELTIIGIGENQPIAIYDMHGCEVYRGVSHTIENLAHGIYIVKVGNKAVKVMI